MLATGRGDRRGVSGRSKNGRAGADGTDSRFEVLGRAGEGTLWVVYRVRERVAGQAGQVGVLKALKGAFNRHARLPDALLESCAAWCGLDHPHLAAPLEVGREDETLFFVSQWLSGGSLEARLSRALSREEVLSIAAQIVAALRFAHERGLTHGDLRPRQLLFDAGGNLKLTDAGVGGAFAAAGLAMADVQPDAAWYLAPERTQGAALAPPADVYALGVVLYRMLANRVPFDGPSPLAIALRHRSDVPLAPSQFNTRCPADLEELALRLLEKDPARRLDAPAVERALQAMGAPVLSFAPSQTIVPVATAPAAATVPAPAVAAPVPLTNVAPTNAATDAAAPDDAETLPVNWPRRRPLSPLVDEAMAARDEADIRAERATLKRRHRRREFWGALGALLWLIVLGAALGGMFYGAYFYWNKATPKVVRVPSYVGLEQSQAQQELAKVGLTLRVVRETYDSKKPEGTVVSGQPEPGRMVRARREVSVTISQGEAPLTMYDFSELPLAQARQIISQHAMRLGPIVEQFHDRVPRGYICGQYPEVGESFRRSEPITLIVSRGPQPKEIDATTGQGPLGGAPSGDAPSNDASSNDAPFDPALPGADATSEGVAAVSRVALIRVQIPSNGGSQQVRVVVRDADGEHTVYSKTHRAGDLVQEKVRVRRPQGTTALVRVYVGSALIKEEQL